MTISPRKSPHQLLVITYWDRDDPLVVNYTLPYVRIMQKVLPAGSRIHLVTLDQPGEHPRKPLAMEGVVHHGFRYHPLRLASLWQLPALVFSLSWLIVKHRIHTVHAWCTPAGMVGYLVSLLTRRPLVIDSYEPHAEAMVENGTWKKGGLAYRVLFLFEKLQTRRAEVVIAATEGMRDYAQRKYGHVPDRFFVKPACVDLSRFSREQVKRPDLLREMGLEQKLVAVYAGKFGGIYLQQEVFDLFCVARNHWGERFHVLLLTSHPMEELLPLIKEAGLSPAMFTIRWATPEELPSLLGLADWALTPVKPVPTKRYCTPIKDGEYWAAGLPVMITKDISDDSEIIAEKGIGVVVNPLNRTGFSRAVEEMDALLKEYDRIGWYGRIRTVAEQYRHYGIAERVYGTIYGNVGSMSGPAGL